MSTPLLVGILTVLVLGGGLFFFGSTSPEPTPTEHVMPDGTVMENTDPAMNVPGEAHVMPDGTMMHNNVPMEAPTPVADTVPVQKTTAPVPPPQSAPSNPSTTSMPMDHSMMGHSM